MIMQVTDCAPAIGAVRTRSPLSRTSCLYVLNAQPLSPAVGNGDAFAALIVVADEHALRFGHRSAVGTQLVLELEALRAESRGPHFDLDGLPPADGRAEVDLGPREDHVLQR